jgi:PST family polysaccharide transporter
MWIVAVNDSSSPEAQPIVTRKRVLHGVAFTVMSQGGKVAINFIGTIILGRLLLPSDFGLLAAVNPVLGFAIQLQNLGLTQAIVQRETISRHQINALFWVSIAISASTAAVICAAAPWIADFFHDRRLIPLYIVSSASIILSAASAQPIALLNRNLQFRAIAIRDLISSSLTTGIAIYVAWATHSYWALVIGQVFPPLVTFIICARAANWRPGMPRFDKEALGMIRFGASVSLYNVTNFLARNLDNVMIGHFENSHALGLYDRAYKLLMYPLTQAIFPVGRVILPTLSRLNGDPVRYRYAYLRVLKALLMLIHPGLLVTIVFSDLIIGVLLGSRWLDAAAIFSVLGVAGLHQMFTSTLGWLYVSQGRGGDYAKLGFVVSPVTIASFVIGIHWGVLGLAISYVISELSIRFPYTLWHVGRSGPISSRYLLKAIAPNILALASTTAALCLIDKYGGLGPILQLAVAMATAYIAYVTTLALFPSERRLMAAMLSLRHGL